MLRLILVYLIVQNKENDMLALLIGLLVFLAIVVLLTGLLIAEGVLVPYILREDYFTGGNKLWK